MWKWIFHCSDPTLKTFSNISKRLSQRVVHIDLPNSSITTLPHFSSKLWPQFHTVDVRNNVFLSCSSVLRMQKAIPNIQLYSECMGNSSLTTEVCNTTRPWLHLDLLYKMYLWQTKEGPIFIILDYILCIFVMKKLFEDRTLLFSHDDMYVISSKWWNAHSWKVTRCAPNFACPMRNTDF